MRGQAQRGNTLLEFTLVGIPMIFVLISIFELARGMWVYTTLAHAIKEGVRFAIVHGQNCDPDVSSNNCCVTVADIAQRIRDAGVGLDPALLQLTFITPARSIPTGTLQSYLTKNTAADYWPTNGPGSFPLDDPAASVGTNLTITGVFPFDSAISMLWPGTAFGIAFGTFNLPASSTETIQF